VECELFIETTTSTSQLYFEDFIDWSATGDTYKMGDPRQMWESLQKNIARAQQSSGYVRWSSKQTLRILEHDELISKQVPWCGRRWTESSRINGRFGSDRRSHRRHLGGE